MEEKADGGGRRRSRATSSSGTTSTAAAAAAAAAERKEMERRRRQDMKGLCVKLASLIPKEHYSKSKGATRTQLSSLDEAAAYIKKLKERVDELQHRRSMHMTMTSSGGGAAAAAAGGQSTTSGGAGGGSEDMTTRSMMSGEEMTRGPVVEVRQHVQEGSSSLDVVLICSAARPVKFHDVITVLEEEGADIINANFSVAAHKIYYTIYSRAFSSRIGIEASRISERLRAALVIRS